MTLLRYVPEMDIPPRGWAIAYPCHDRFGAMAAPIPLHIIVALYVGTAFRFRRWLWRYSKDNAYQDGLRAGIREGRIIGYREGFAAGVKSEWPTLKTLLDEYVRVQVDNIKIPPDPPRMANARTYI